jgi:predicted HicB family RNase H-like nuclease
MIDLRRVIKLGKISEENTRYVTTLPKTLKQDLEQIAAKDNRSLNNLIVKVLKDFASTRKKS